MTNIAIVKPAVRPVWASTAAAPSSIVDPDTQTINFVANGWPLSATPPSRQYWNWVLNYCMNGVAYFNRRGIVDWDTNETYYIYDVVLDTNGIVYQSLQTNNVANSPQASPAFWGRLQGYALQSDLSAYLTSAQFNSFISGYYSGAQVNAILTNYATISYANAIGNSAISQSETYTLNSLANYVSNGALATALQSYVTNSAFNATLANYVTGAVLNQNVLNLEIYTNNSSASAISQSVAQSEGYTNTQIAAVRGTYSIGGVNATSALNDFSGFQVRFGFSPSGTGSPRNVSFPSFSNNILWGMCSPAGQGGGTTAMNILSPTTAQIVISNASLGAYWVVFGY